MTDFLLELRCEEIPARMQAGARAELERLFRREMASAGVDVADVTIWSTPRRLALIARGLPNATAAVSEEAKGPPQGAPDAAIEGFCRKNGVAKDQLQLRDVKGRMTWFAAIDKPGRATKAVLADAIPAIVRNFAWPKSMRWGAASIRSDSPRWVRPLSGIVAILGEELVECEAAGVRSGYATLGHRFHCPGEITIGGAQDYAEKLRACHVVVDHEERAALIREGARKAAADAGLALVEDESLVTENAGLTEWPVPLLGRFDEAFLDVPPEVIQLTARVNQKYFVCHPPRNGEGDHAKHGGGAPSAAQDLAGTDHPPVPHHPQPAAGGPPPRSGEELANAFICTANIAAADGGTAIIDGNRKVLAARLSDARFFWEQDRKKILAEHAEGLARITFHEKLGTVADKVERVAKLARWLVEEGIVPPRTGEGDHAKHGGGAPSTANDTTGSEHPPVPLHPRASLGGPPPPVGEDLPREQLADFAEQAARLCKADLVTEMVGEFPELQGLMGGYYARAEGLPREVADAIRDHYKPVGQGDNVPTAPVTVAVSLADKLDTLAAFFSIKEKPTGSKDPFALRRAVLGVIAIVLENDLRLSLRDAAYYAALLRIEGAKETNVQALHVPDAVRAVLGDNAEGGFLLDVQCDENFVYEEFPDFVADRLKVQQREAGVRHDLIDAVFALGNEDDLVRLLARVKALQNFIGTEDGANLLAPYKRAANILKKENWPASPLPTGEGSGLGGATSQASNTHPQPLPSREGAFKGDGIPQTGEEDPLAMVDDPDLRAVVDARLADDRAHAPPASPEPPAAPPPPPPVKKQLSYTPEPAEDALIAALDSAEPRAAQAVAAEDFEAAMGALASLRGPIDRFFDEVTVNDENPGKRAARLDLLARFRDAVHSVADFSKIEG